MHGIIFSELKKFVVSKYDDATWGKLLHAAGLQGRNYMPLSTYPDAEVVSLVTTASTMTGTPVPALLESFGEYIAGGLLGMYKSLLKPDWKALDVIENAEGTIHRVVRMKNPGAQPPYLVATRVAPDEVRIVYTSERKLCSVAKGIARGIATAYGEKVNITEPTCMHRGGKQCEISIRKAS